MLAAIVAGSLGCAGSALRAADLPDAPIAIHWRDPETARKYAEWRASQQDSAEHRITSYNVCYTKLLRLQVKS